MQLSRTAISFCALLAAVPTLAQDIQLDPITVEDASDEGFFGAPVALDTGSVMKSGDPILETPRSVGVVTAEEIQQRGAQDVEEVLAYSTGVAVGEYGLDNRSDWYLIRGFRPSTFHDGLQARYGFYNDTKPEPFLLDSVEILRGPASGLYGNGEVAGVVNTTSKTAAEDSPNVVQLQFGSFGRKQVGVDYGSDLTADGTLSYRVVGLLRDADAQVDYSRDDAFAIAPSITWRPTAATSLTVLANVQRNRTSPMIQFASVAGTRDPAPNGRFLPDSLFVGEPGFDRFDADQDALTVLFEHRFNSVWSTNVNARYTQGTADYRHAWWAYDNFATNRYNPDGTINRTFYRAENEMESFNLDANATAEYRLGTLDMRTLTGIGYTRGEYDSDFGYGAETNPIDPFDPVYTGFPDIAVTDTPANTVEEWGAYVQNRASLDDRLHIDFGLRFGRIETGETSGTFRSAAISASDEAMTKNLAVLYRFDNGLAPYASYAESFRQEIVGSDAAGDPFEPTRGKQYELGVKYQPPGTNTLLTAAVFDLIKSNLTVADPANPGFQIQTGEAKVRGLEFDAVTRIGDFTLDAGYTVLDTENVSGERIETVPEDYGSIWVNYAPLGSEIEGWSVGLGARYSGAKWDGAGNRSTPSYMLYDASVGYTSERYDLRLNVRNLTDERHVTYCGGGACYFGEGRTATLTGTIKF
ncbi:TonB-dependent siderophore receptor [Halovulum dunhuangense]|uniref:TonB-dependent siderophore receptor n=1 Tax=Halovulum dunhuangense TaxID=1505036 RepID=A0A849L6R3_9RHOB|nr:TonB-dependent siderophore receptor [Halovulum dunhuangense]NNU82145.1 TonB-dependent siderophore receptor [Halovulum dunhuangense]